MAPAYALLISFVLVFVVGWVLDLPRSGEDGPTTGPATTTQPRPTATTPRTTQPDETPTTRPSTSPDPDKNGKPDRTSDGETDTTAPEVPSGAEP